MILIDECMIDEAPIEGAMGLLLLLSMVLYRW